MPDPQLVDEAQTIGVTTEPKGAAALAFQMINQAAQCDILAATVGTMIHLLAMHRTTKVLVEPRQLRKPPLAWVAAVPGSIPRGASRQIGSRAIVVPAYFLVGGNVIGIDLSTILVNLLAVDAG